MKTKTVPVMIMLIAGAVACILGIVNNYATAQFFKMMLTVLVVFYILGCIIKLILDKNFSVEENSKNEEKEASEAEKENIESDSEAKNDK